MLNMIKFNYIITIHNKEHLIAKVLNCVLMCCRDNSHVYLVLDGCIDNTEKIVDGIINEFAHIAITKVITSDVHEILSINAGLRVANQEGKGFNIILQDDVLLLDTDLEDKVKRLYNWAGHKLGYVSFRMGANFKIDAYKTDEPTPIINLIENACGNGLLEAEMLPLGCFAYRTVAIKSPVCIPFEIVRSIGLLEEGLAPYSHDDIEYSIRLVKAGYRNGVFAIRFCSDVKWGGTRVSPHPMMGKIQKRNMAFIRKIHKNDLINICSHQKKENILEINGLTEEAERKESIALWKKNRKDLNEYTNKVRKKTKWFVRLMEKIKVFVKEF